MLLFGGAGKMKKGCEQSKTMIEVPQPDIVR
jgi:hypothetical protein